MRRSPWLLGAFLLLGCGSSEDRPPDDGGTGAGTTVLFNLGADLATQEAFYDLPYPSDLRLTKQGTPDLTGLPYPPLVKSFVGIRDTAMLHPGFPVIPVGYFRFSAPLAELDVKKVIPADKASPILLIDVDEASSDRGKLYPTVATLPPVDGYVPENVLAVGARPGIVLHPGRKYAFVVMKAVQDAAGKPLSSSKVLDDLRAGTAPSGDKGAAVLALYKPLWETLDKAAIDAAGVAAATVFTTGDVVAELFELSTKLMAKYSVTIDNLQVDPDDGAAHPRYCELVGKVTFPQFQKGKPPFDTEGLFDYSDDGLPAKQRDEIAPLTITLPKGEMPAAGFPLVVYFHGSGGLSTAIADRGTWTPQADASKCPEGTLSEWLGVKGCNTKGEGPAHVLAPFGLAVAGSALPVNPQRLPGAGETAYLNFNNLGAGHDLFRQGVIEQRLFIEALSKLEIPAATLAACAGTTLPAGATAFKLDVKNHLFAQGQSMGGQYTNLVGATEPRIRAAVPTGAGGYWSHFILITPLIPNPAGVIGTLLLGTQAPLTFLHPALSIFATSWEGVDPMVYMPRLSRRPLEGHPVRSVYEPVGKGDSYFPEETYDAMALAYAHQQAGDQVLGLDAGGAGPRGQGRDHQLSGLRQPRLGDGRQVHRRHRSIRGRRRLRPSRALFAEGRGEVPVWLLPLDLPPDGQGQRARARAARHALPARQVGSAQPAAPRLSSRTAPSSPTSTTWAMPRKIPVSTTPGIFRIDASSPAGSSMGPKSVSRIQFWLSVKKGYPSAFLRAVAFPPSFLKCRVTLGTAKGTTSMGIAVREPSFSTSFSGVTSTTKRSAS